MPTNNRFLHTCSGCGSKFYPTESEGCCPYCQATTSELLEFYRRYLHKKKVRQKQIKTAITRLSLIVISLIALIVLLISLIVGVTKESEKLIYTTDDVTNQPVFYTNSDDEIYYLSHKNESILIGKGEISGYTASDDGRIVFLVLEGTTDVDSLNLDKSLLIKISDYRNVETIAESSYGEITFVAGGNCNYLYYLITETLGTYQSSARLNLYRSSSADPVRICDYTTGGDFDDFRVSANGRYLIYKAQDGDGTKLMKFSVRTGESENLGVKNSEPISIDNKGKYFSYLRMNEYNLLDFYIESNVSDREKYTLDSMFADRIIVSADYRNFIIETGDLTSFVSRGNENFTVVAPAGSGLSHGIDEYKSTEIFGYLDNLYIKDIDYSVNSSFLPYYYIHSYGEGKYTLMTVNRDGEKQALIDGSFEGFATNGDKFAFFTQDALYTANVDVRKISQKLVSENFSRYVPRSISSDGKYIFLYDADKNVYRIPYNFNGSNLVNIATDASIYEASDSGKEIYYISGDTLYYGTKNQAYRVCEKVVDSSVYITDDFSKVYYLAQSANSKAENTYGLYVYDGKNSKAISMNIKNIDTCPASLLGYTVLPESKRTANTDSAEISE